MKTIIATVADVKVTKNGLLFVKAEHNGELIGAQTNQENTSESININSIKFKTIKANSQTASALKAGQGYAGLIGSANNRITSTEKYGNFIVGSTTFTAHPENIRIGGVFRLNGQITSTMPSTIVTPMPMLKFDFPLSSTLKNLSDILTDYKDFVSGIL